MISFSESPGDYSKNTPVNLEFLKCNSTKQCHCIDLVEDNKLEDDEIFYVSLEEAHHLDENRITLAPVNAEVEIIDNKSRKCAAYFVTILIYTQCILWVDWCWHLVYIHPMECSVPSMV